MACYPFDFVFSNKKHWDIHSSAFSLLTCQLQLAFVCYLKLSIPKEQMKIEERFDKALKSIAPAPRK